MSRWGCNKIFAPQESYAIVDKKRIRRSFYGMKSCKMVKLVMLRAFFCGCSLVAYNALAMDYSTMRHKPDQKKSIAWADGQDEDTSFSSNPKLQVLYPNPSSLDFQQITQERSSHSSESEKKRLIRCSSLSIKSS